MRACALRCSIQVPDRSDVVVRWPILALHILIDVSERDYLSFCRDTDAARYVVALYLYHEHVNCRVPPLQAARDDASCMLR